MNDEWRAPISALLDREGEGVEHNLDQGGCTRYGWTLSAYRFAVRREISCEELRGLSRETCGELYWQHWVTHPTLNLQIMYPQRVAEVVLDTAVLFGRSRAVMMLQNAIPGIKFGGWIGQQTREALAMSDSRQVISRIVAQRVMTHSRRVQKSPDQAVFIAGWHKRALDWLMVA